jgi:putative membrane protein
MRLTFPSFLLLAYIVLFCVLGWEPYSREVWFAENLPMLIIVAVILWVHNSHHHFSHASLVMMSVLIVLHSIGGHYTFERVPFDWVTNFFGFERNHYDRVSHFSVGFYAYAIAELLWGKRLVNNRWMLFLFPLFSIFTVAAVYEIIEWQYAISANEEAGIAVLGSQGDIWDAQKDMLADSMGALVAMLMFFVVRRPVYPQAIVEKQ